MSLDADKIASLGLTLAVLREAFNSSDSAERVANMDVPAVTRSAVEGFDEVRNGITLLTAEVDALAVLHRQAQIKWAAERDALNTLLGYASEALKFTGLKDHLVDFEFVESVKATIDLRLQGVEHEPLPATEQNKYDVVLKPFTRLMERELHANSSKGDRPAWLKMTAGECLLEIYYHAGKLHKAVHGSQGDGILEYAADVANLSMMLTDIVGALGIFAHDEAANAEG